MGMMAEALLVVSAMLVTTVFALALLSLAGIPPLAGFAGKVFLLVAAIDGRMSWLALAAAINMAIGLYYYARLIAEMFFTTTRGSGPIGISIGYICAATVTTLATVGLGIAPDAALALARAASLAR